MVAELSNKVKALKFMQRTFSGNTSSTNTPPLNKTPVSSTVSLSTKNASQSATPDNRHIPQIITCPDGKQVVIVSTELSLPALFSLDQKVVQEQAIKNKHRKGVDKNIKSYAPIVLTRRKYEGSPNKNTATKGSSPMDIDEGLPTRQRKYRLQTEENGRVMVDDEEDDYDYMNNEGPFISQDDFESTHNSGKLLEESKDTNHRVPGSSMKYKRSSKTSRPSYSSETG